MTNIPVNSFSAGITYPKYVTDETLKRARTEDANGDPAVRVAFNDVEPDLSEIESRIGTKTEAKWDDSVDTNAGSVISILKSIDFKMKDLTYWKHLADGPGTVSLTNSTTFNLLNMIGGVKPANLKYLVLITRLHGGYTATWIYANAGSNTHFVVKQEELGKFTNDPSEHILSGIQFVVDKDTWVMSIKGCYYTHTYWDDVAGTISITNGSHHDITQFTFTFDGIEGVFFDS